jgi:hypothetical protein
VSRQVPQNPILTEFGALRADKTTAGIPCEIHLQRGITDQLGTLFVYPLPSDAHTLILYLNTQLAAIPENDAGLSTDYNLPPGYGLRLRRRWR